MNRRRVMVLLGAAAALVSVLGSSVPAQATLPGVSGRIAFWDFNTGQVYTVAPDGSGLRQLTNVDAAHVAALPKWSPDGSRILFYVGQANTLANARMWIMRADGTHAHQLSHDRAGFSDYTGVFTPDGRRIVFTRCQPNGFPAGDEGVCAIWQMRADGSHMRPITPFRVGRNEAVDIKPSVSVRGEIAFLRFFWRGVAAQDWIIPRAGAAARPATPVWLEADRPDWAPSGRSFYTASPFWHSNAQLYQVSAVGAHLRRLTNPRYPQNDFEPTPSPDGRRIAFASDRRYPDFCCVDLFAADTDGTHLHRIPTGQLTGVLDPSWGPRTPSASSPTPQIRTTVDQRRPPFRLATICRHPRSIAALLLGVC
jgi:TolB protein